jgi:GNAT superfamily N-acetyltransferase
VTAVVRPARPADLAALWDLLQGLAGYERLEPEVTGNAEALGRHLFAATPSVEALVAEADDGALVGYALFFTVFSSFRTVTRLWLEDLYVTPESRGTGLGRRLLAEVARRARERGAAGVSWIVLDWNADAIGFYEGLGARPSGGGWTTYSLSGPAFESLAARD